MESRTKWHSCRLIVHHESGRLKWCVGPQKTWDARRKYLVLIPVILLPVTLLCVFLTQYSILSKTENLNETSATFTSSDYKEKELMRAEDRDILQDIETAFIPPEPVAPTLSGSLGVKMHRRNAHDYERDQFENVTEKTTNEHNKENTSSDSLLRKITNKPRRRKTTFDTVFKKRNGTLCVTSENGKSGFKTLDDYMKNSRYCNNKDILRAKLKYPMDLFENDTVIEEHSRVKRSNQVQESIRHVSKATTNSTDAMSRNMYSESDSVNSSTETNSVLETKQTSENILNENIYFSLFQEINMQNKSTSEMIRKSQANLMSRYMDTKANPCDDFYRYACGNWDQYNPIPLDKSAYNTFEVLREKLDYVLKLLLEEDGSSTDNKESNETTNKDETQPSSINDSVMKAKLYYKSCMNTSILQERGHGPLMDLMKQLGGWPIIDQQWNETQFNWLKLIAQLRLYNNDILISQWIGPDIQNSHEYIIQLDQTTLGLPSRDYYLDPANQHYLDAYKSFMISIVALLGSPESVYKTDVDNMIAFETELAKIVAPAEKRSNVTDLYQRLTISELQLIIPQIAWTNYFNPILNREVSENLQILCYAMEYMQRLTELVKKTPPRTLANYILWRFVRHRINNLDDTFQPAKEKFYFVLYGSKKSPPRWQNCVTQVNSNMGMAVGRLFVKKYFDEFSKNDTLQMTLDIQKSFRELLSQTNWLEPDTRNLALMKVDSMKLRIGYPDFLLNINELTDKYSDIDIQSDKYFENTLSILQHLTRSEQARLNKSVDKRKWNTAPAVVNAYYSRNKNQIIFPAGILQPPFYHQHFPRALNFGGIGIVIGHEITHGFDDKGRLFDRDGNLQRWWNDNDVDKFHGRAKCLIEQYNKYTITEIGVQVDGTNTQGENIADNGGIKQAYLAYRKWRNQNPQADETLPGLNMTENKLFFLNFAQVWCGAMRPEATRNKVKTAVHSPGRYRVIGTLSNFPEFAKEFNCPVGSRMNPNNKCNVW